MALKRRAITVSAAAVAAFAMVVPPASAATTTVRAGGDPYSGAVQANLIGEATVSTSLGEGVCAESAMTGSVTSDGTALSVSSADFGGTDGTACQGDAESTLTPQNLPWAGGSVVHAPVAGGKDADITIANFQVQAVVNILGGITCTYGGSLVAAGYNPGNPDRPDGTVNQAQVRLSAAVIDRVSPSGLACPGTATVTATYTLTGESTPGSGVFDQILSVTE